MNYRTTVATIREERDRELARVRAEATRAIEEARVARDREMRSLAAKGRSVSSIAQEIGYSYAQVHEILHGKRDENNRRRREHWRLVYGGKAA